MPTFLEIYGVLLDRELGTEDRTQRFTTVRRKAYVNEGVAKFNEQTSCYVKRVAIALVDGTQEYDLEAVGILAAEDFLWTATVGATLRKTVTSSGAIADIEGDSFQYASEEDLNHTEPGWRTFTGGAPSKWFTRVDGASQYVGLHVTPDIPSTETWALRVPYVAKVPTLSADADIPFNSRIALTPYHDAVLAYAAAQCEKLRKDYEAVDRQMRAFGALVAKYVADQMPKVGTRIRLAVNYRQRLRAGRPINPFTGV